MANRKKALDENGVLYLWGKVKTYVATGHCQHQAAQQDL